MMIPDYAQVLLDKELRQLSESIEYSLQPDSRKNIYTALGPSSVYEDQILDEARNNNTLPSLSPSDRLRAQIALSTARKVEKLWQQACLETESNFSKTREPLEIQREEELYLVQRKQIYLEQIPIFDVPRAFLPSHILEMAELALSGKIHDYGAFRNEANECWQLYGNPEQMEREFFIKMAAQEALYMAIGWAKYNNEPPAANALYAFAGIFEGDDFDSRKCVIDKSKQNEFWIWWLSEAIPQAFSNDDVS